MFRALHTRPEKCKKGKQWTEDGGEGVCKKNASGESECLCMDGKEVTCAWAPPAKFRSAKGDDYAGEFLFFTKVLLFIYLFFQVYRKQEKCEEGKEWKEFKGERDFAKTW